ncbi:MAG: bifunctional folylpolyglutamate synthase/dihydrofolate synthase [Firmicutes bacterium]|nr:bifunctional folylpolyglutamate synthase/dihydrofolate synthase [Bacillota bacterium]
MNYNEALDYIHSTGKFGSKLGLDNIKVLLDLLDNPQRDLKYIHVAGTNGKGSTSSFMSNILAKEGYKVGLFTSPYLEKFTERIRINNDYIPKERLAQLTKEVKDKIKKMLDRGYAHPTEFEIVTAIALKYYSEEEIDIVILEVGLGGRYDATNVIEDSLVSVLTPISYDHINVLGDTLEKIAWEKAGIIKENNLVVSYPQEVEAQNVIKNIVKEKNGKLVVSPLENINIKNNDSFGSTFDFTYKDFEFKNLSINLLGFYQIYNASLALTVLLTLKEKGLIKLKESSIKKGLKSTTWNGRLEIISKNPNILIDGAHNIEGAKGLKKTLLESLEYDRLILGIAMLKDKDVENVLKEIIPLTDTVIVTEVKGNPRALKAEELKEKIKKYNSNCIIKKNINKAVYESLNLVSSNDLIVFSGSLYLIGDVRTIIKGK